MGLWDGMPYELQSPRWRTELNKADGKPGAGAALNENFTTKFLDAQVAMKRAQAQANGVNTTQIDGQTPFVEGLASFGGALLQSIGVRPDGGAPQMQATPAAWGSPPPRDMDMKTLLMLGAVGFGAFMIWGR